MTKSRDIADSINRIDSSAANATVMTIDANENVLVGKTTTAFGTQGIRLQGPDGKVESTRNGNVVMALNRLTTDGTILEFAKDSTTVGSIKCRSSGANLQIDTGQSGIDFAGDGYLPMRNGSIVDNDLDIGSSSFRFNDLYLGGGAYIGGTGSANYLDDYEEGTFDIKGSNTGYTLNSTYNRGEYTKIGNVVTCVIYIKLASATSGSTFYIDLPFTVKVNGTNSANSSVGPVMYENFNAASGMTDLVLFAASNSNKARLFQSFDNAGWSSVITGNLTGNENFYCAVTYRTA
jgi:hypothetical protein